MSFYTIDHVGISGICACVPPKTIDNLNYPPLCTDKKAKRMVHLTGVKERRFAEQGVCASDLACQAGEKLLSDMRIDRSSVDLLIFLSQTPDYNGVPPTAPSLQHRLGLSQTTGAFDMTMNCSGFLYALSCAFAYASCGMKVLLLVGETMSKITSPEDWETGLLFGDAGAAVLIEKGERFGRSYFSLNSDGSFCDLVKIPDGGCRNPVTEASLEMKTYPNGSRRSNLHVHLNGGGVYEFSGRIVVPTIQNILKQSSMTVDDIDSWIFYQVSLHMLKMIAAELKVPEEKVPITLDRFGNTSTVSIPLGITASYGGDRQCSPGRSMIFAYGAGMSYGGCITDIRDCYIGKLEDYRA